MENQIIFWVFVVRTANGRFAPSEIDIKPTFAVGYLIGLILGDGSCYASKVRDYRISFKTTRKEFADIIVNAFSESFPTLKTHRYSQVSTRRFPNGQVKTDLMYGVDVNSKRLYEYLHPYKLADYRWIVPPIVYQTMECTCGFLSGLYDAEGCVAPSKKQRQTDYIDLSSKHAENLQPIQTLLENLEIKSRIYFSRTSDFRLRVNTVESLIKLCRILKLRIVDKERKMKIITNKKRREPLVIKCEGCGRENTVRAIKSHYGHTHVHCTICGWKTVVPSARGVKYKIITGQRWGISNK